MKLEIPPTKLLIAIFACTLSIVSTTDYSIFDDANQIATKAAALPNSEFRRYNDVPETIQLLRRSVRQDTSNTMVKNRHHRPVVINVTGDHRDSFDFEHPLEYGHIVQKSDLANLHTADRLAENTVSIFGYILESPNNRLTIEQYSSLETIHNAIKRRQFHMYRLLRELNALYHQPCISQFVIIMLALKTELPPYLACAANFLTSQINLGLLDVTTLGIDIMNLNFLTGIKEKQIRDGRLYVKEMEQNGYDDASRTTEAIVGPFFVHIFTLMSKHKLTVSQPLFAGILLNLPNRDGDPIFNEYVRFVANVAWEGKIPNWSAKSYTPMVGDDIHFLIDAMVGTICRDPDVTYDIKQALWYIRNHFEKSVKYTVPPSANLAYRVSQGGIHIRQLFALITPQEFGPRATHLKDHLTEYIASHQFVIQKTIAGLNSYGYTSPKQLLLAFLARLRTRLPAEEIEIRESVSALLSILMVKRQAWNLVGLHEGGVTLWTLLDAINDSQTDPKIAELVQTVLNELLSKVGLWSAISNMKLDYMGKCDSAEVCLREMLQNLVEHLPPNSLSPETHVVITKLIDMISVEISRYSEGPLMCACPSSLQPYTTVTTKIPSEPLHYYTTTVGPSTPEISEPHSEEPSVHHHTTTVGLSTSESSESHSEEQLVHYRTTTVGPSTPEISEPHSEEPSVHHHTTTVGLSTSESSESHSEEPSVHHHTTTVGLSTSESSEPYSVEPSVHYRTTTVGPSTPEISEPHSEEPSVHHHTTTVGLSTSESSESHSEEPSVHHHTTTVGLSTSESSEPYSVEPSVHYRTTTVGPSTPKISEPHSEEPSVHHHTTTVGLSTSESSESHSEEPSVHHHTTTVGLSTSESSEPYSVEPSVHYRTTTVGPSTPEISEPHSEEPSVHHHTTTVGLSTSESSESHSEEPSVHHHTTTVGLSTSESSEPYSVEPSVHYRTTTVGPSTPEISEPHSEEPSVHHHTTTVGLSTSESSESHSEEPSVHHHTTTVGLSTSESSEPYSVEPSVHYRTTTVGPSTPEISEPHSEEPSVHHHTTTVGLSTSESSEPYSVEPSVHHHTTTVGLSTSESSEPYSVEPSVHYHTTTVRPLITTTIGDSGLLNPINKNKTTVTTDILLVPVLPPLVNPEEVMHVRVPESGFTAIKNVRIDENSNSSEIVTVPSIVCLEENPRTDKFKGECKKSVRNITHILIRVFSEDYVQVLLGDDWGDRYPTRISFLVALLENAEKSNELSNQRNDLRIITRYKEALRYVSAYVLLPLIASSQNLTTGIVWSTYNPENPSECNIGSDRPHEVGEKVLTLPLVNPSAWLLPVDTAHPFANLFPQLPPDDPYAILIHPLTELCNTGHIRDYLGSDWDASQYTNRGALLVTMLHIILKQDKIPPNQELNDVVRRYLVVMERSTLYIHIPRAYVDNLVQQYHELPEPSDRIIPTTNVWWSEQTIEMLTRFVSLPSVQRLPSLVYPGISIHVNVSYPGMARLEPPNSAASSDIVMLPSFDCLLNKPSPEDSLQSRCQKDLIPISLPLRHIFGANYIPELLGDHWKILYPTRISLLVALLTTAKQNQKCQAHPEFIAVIDRYKAACEFVASYVLLPIVVDSQNLNTITVWSTFDFENLWRSTIGTHEADGFGPDAVTLPLINPKIWLTTVDPNYPFAYLLPYLPENDPRFSRLQPLYSLFESGEIKNLLGSSWTASDYPDRGSLFVSVLRMLLTLEVVTSDRQLYTLVYNYLMALELPALYVHVPHSYVKTIFDQYNIPWMEERYIETIGIPTNIMLPPLINPKKILQVIVPESGTPVVESVRSKKSQLKLATILPSVNCLQGASTADDDEAAGDTCDSVLEFRLTEPLIEVFGDDYVEKILGADWNSLYPTRISFLAGLLRNAVQNEIIVASPNQLHKKVTTFKEALEVAAPYIFLPMLANYQQLATRTVWLTYNYEKPWQSHMGRNPPQYPNNSTVTLPLVNPRVWYLPVNRNHPFSGFLPDFPSTNPYEEIIAPLRSVLTVQYLRDLTGSEWEPSQYPNRGVFFVSAMHTLLKLGSTRMNPELYSLVRSYYMAIEIPSLYIHIPRSYINNAVNTAHGAWNVDLDGLIVAVMEARTEEERRYLMILKIFLKYEDLLKQLAIVLPSSTTTKHVFLSMIIRTALASTTIQLTEDTIVALKACQTRILTTGAGAEVVGWIWVSRVITTTIIDLGNMVSVVIPIERVPEERRGAYHELLQYFEQHRKILITEDFPAYRYHTNGAFLRGYLNHLVYKSRVSDEAKANIELVIPYIRYTGPGAEPVALFVPTKAQ